MGNFYLCHNFATKFLAFDRRVPLDRTKKFLSVFFWGGFEREKRKEGRKKERKEGRKFFYDDNFFWIVSIFFKDRILNVV